MLLSMVSVGVCLRAPSVLSILSALWTDLCTWMAIRQYTPKQGVFGIEKLDRWRFWHLGSALQKMPDALQLDLHLHPSKFRQQYQLIVRSEFIKKWTSDRADTSKHPILRTYRYIKSSFSTEPYIKMVTKINAIAVLYPSQERFALSPMYP